MSDLQSQFPDKDPSFKELTGASDTQSNKNVIPSLKDSNKLKKKRIKRKKDHNNPPIWRTEEIAELSRKRDKLYSLYKKKKDKEIYNAYKKLRNTVNGKIRIEKKKLEEALGASEKNKEEDESVLVASENEEINVKAVEKDSDLKDTKEPDNSNEFKATTDNKAPFSFKKFTRECKPFFQPPEHDFNTQTKFV